MRRVIAVVQVSRRGLTIVEVLVGIAVIGLLAAILIPAVQQARAAARRSTCQSNMRQVGAAMHNFAELIGKFPTSAQPTGFHWRIMPFLDQKELMESLISGKPRIPMRVSTYECPSDPFVSDGFGNLSYYLNEGTLFNIGPLNGFATRHSDADRDPRQISDGLSNTAALAERQIGYIFLEVERRPPESQLESEPRRAYWFTKTRFSQPGEEFLAVDECRSNRTTVSPQFASTGAVQYFTSEGYDHLLVPNSPACYNGPETVGLSSSLFLVPASSGHYGGANVLMSDGSVHMASESIDSKVWSEIGTASGKEPTTLPF